MKLRIVRVLRVAKHANYSIAIIKGLHLIVDTTNLLVPGGLEFC